MRAPIHPLSLLSALALASCGPEPTDPGTDTDPVVETDTVDDTDPHSDTPIDTDDTDDTDVTLTDTGSTGGTPVTVSTSGPVVCPNPGDRGTEIYDQQRGPESRGEPEYRGHGAGIVAGDWDGSGKPGVVVLHEEYAEAYRQTAPGVFSVTDGGYDWAGIDMGFGANTVDFDGDRDLDIFVTRYTKANLLLENDGTGRFTDVAPARGVAACGSRGLEHHSSSSVWGDIDRDGDLDLYVGGHGFVDEYKDQAEWDDGDSDCLFLNDGAGNFTDASDRIPHEAHRTYVLVPSLVDLDRDGFLDLYLSNDFGARFSPCKLLWNRGGGASFELDGGASGLDYAISGMGVALDDVNDDDVPDILVPAWSKHGFGVSEKSVDIWFDHYIDSGLAPDNENQEVAWGAEFADVDNDTDSDVVMVFGYIDTNTGPENDLGQRDGIWLQQPDGRFEPAPTEWDFDRPTAARGLLVADLDADGWVDLGVPDMHGPAVIHMSRCGTQRWLEVTLRSPGQKNTHAVGAEVVVTAGSDRMWRQILAGGTSYGSGGPPVAHFGLGAHERADRIEIRWPDGAVSWLEDVEANQILTIER